MISTKQYCAKDSVWRSRSMRGTRCSSTEFAVRAHEFVAGVIRDYGHGVQHCADAIWESLRSLCIKCKGKRNRDNVTGPGDALDEGLLKIVQDIILQAQAMEQR